MNTPSCACSSLDDLAVIDMGKHEEVFRSLEVIRTRGSLWWWLYASTCRECGQTWLVAKEERQNDVFILKRLDQATAERLLRDTVWPTDFDRFEKLLEIGRDAGKTVRYFDVLDSPLVVTMTDLARERPGICISELAALLNLDQAIARELAREATGVEITFDVD